MRLLLDSHAVLWWLDEDGPLPLDVRGLIDDVANDVAVSVATVWELAIEVAKGQLRTPDHMVELLDAQEVEVLDLSASHALAAAALPLHHKDPFDRMIIAQAMHDDYVIVTSDRRFADYGVAVLSAR